jgi:membrane-associated protease RseP (regulator of RpoE activity)
MKHLRIVLAVAIMAFAAFGVAAAQDATSTPLPETAAPEATAVPEVTTVPDAEVPGTATASSPFMGIQFDAADHGVEVIAILPGGPAEEAGIEVGDVVTAINGVEVSEDNVRETVQGFVVGDTVTVDVMRDGEIVSLEVTLGEAPADGVIPGTAAVPRFEMFEVERPRLGIIIGDSETGVLVNEVEADSPAEAAGIEAGDVITAINNEAVATPQEAAEAVAQAVANAVVGEFDVTVTVTRGEETLDLVATLVKPEMPAIPDMPGFGGRGRDDRGFGFGPGMGMGGFNLIPREGEEGAFDLVVPFRPANPDAVTDDVTAALADLGIRIVPREGEEGLFDLYVPAETLGEMEGGFILPHLEMFRGMMPHGFQFRFDGPMGRGFNFEIPDIVIPTEPAPEGEGSA